MKKTIISCAFGLLLAAAFITPAFAEELIVGGQAVGIQISTEGVLVAGLCKPEGVESAVSPAEEAGIKEGDLILSVDGRDVYNAASLIAALDAAPEGPVLLKIRRDGRETEISVEPGTNAEGRRMLGLWLRDGLSGIGTLTFCDPESLCYGALGHSVNDSAGGGPSIREGFITQAQIVGVNPGSPGSPGELRGVADLGRVLGGVDINSPVGIFGSLYSALDGQRMETGVMSAGPASLISTVSGQERREYSVEINRVYRESGGTHAMLTVTDSELLSRTGGIVQGMSGSPIIQNGKLVGALTHVFVNEPQRGYAVSIQDMLSAAGLSPEEQAA